MCPLVKELKSRPDEFQTVVTVTGQHREMLYQVLRVFDVTPDHDLAIMKPGQTLFDVTCDVLLKLKAVVAGLGGLASPMGRAMAPLGQAWM